MQLQVSTFPSKLFCHYPESKRLVAEVSDLPGFQGFQRLYDDAADVGFALRNAHTGNITRWSMADEIRCTQENELHGWYFVPSPESIHKNPQLAGYCITLIND